METIFQFRNKVLYFGMGACAVLLFFSALGPGLFTSELNAAQSWQYLVFKDLCHQQAARSFTLNGLQMAVCSRCFGIYTALMTGWLILPLISQVVLGGGDRWLKNLLGISVLINIIDVAGNYFTLWSNSNLSRLLLGLMLGLCVAILFKNEFFQIQKKRLTYE